MTSHLVVTVPAERLPAQSDDVSARSSGVIAFPTSADQDRIPTALGPLVSAAFPMVVFTSLASISVAHFSDRCLILLYEHDLSACLIERPAAANVARKPSTTRRCVTLRTSFADAASPNAPTFHGVVLHLWNAEHQLTRGEVVAARGAVDEAVAVVARQRAIDQYPNARPPDRDGPRRHLLDADRALHLVPPRWASKATGPAAQREDNAPLGRWGAPY